jgi:hypothetical protein
MVTSVRRRRERASGQVPVQFLGGLARVPTHRSTTKTAQIHAPTRSGTAMTDHQPFPSRLPPMAQTRDARAASRQRGPNIKFDEFNLSMRER